MRVTSRNGAELQEIPPRKGWRSPKAGICYLFRTLNEIALESVQPFLAGPTCKSWQILVPLPQQV